jgi:multidrug efflux system membrane fusion protein
MNRLRRYIAIFIGCAAVIGVTAYVVTRPAQQQQAGGFGRGFRGGGGGAPVPILAADAKTADVPLYIDAVGTIRALNTVTVRAQVDGKLTSINFTEGQDVKPGDVLAQIDPTTFQAALDQAVAKKAQDEALLSNARRDLERYTRLVATNALAQQQADTQRSLVAQYEAQVKSDEAAIENARAIVEYTTIRSPIEGRTGIRQIDVGNIIHASDANGLVVLTQIKPISVYFTIPQQQLSQVNAAFAKASLEVDAFGNDNKTIADRGHLQVVDNQVDQTTGTVRLKAEFPNASLQLWPGQFVNVRLLVDTLKGVTVVPTAAVQRGPNGTFVFLVSGETVAMRPITVSQQDEMQSVVTDGVQPGDRVATTSFNQLTDGGHVTVSTADASQPAPTATTPRRRPDNAGGNAPQRGDGERRHRRDGNSPGAAPGTGQRPAGAPSP